MQAGTLVASDACIYACSLHCRPMIDKQHQVTLGGPCWRMPPVHACMCACILPCITLAWRYACMQGPGAAEVLATLTRAPLKDMYFSDFRTFDVAGSPCWVTRTG